MATFATPTTGQVAPANSSTPVAFDKLDTKGRSGITMPSNGQLRVSESGVYAVEFQLREIDGLSAANIKLEWSKDNGSSWQAATQWTNGWNPENTGRNFPDRTYLGWVDAGTRFRGNINTAPGPTRIGGSVSEPENTRLSVARIS